ncbi:MAG: type II secretion system minor pseudopilin GspK [Rubrivivax sp.]|nr:type II secretion system minor pseudopilin GspK [Rubrivivax sp.]
MNTIRLPCPGRCRAAAQRGAALLLAMIIVALVATITAAMVWQQERAVAIEAAERARGQGSWILNGALDWARLILREDLRGNQQRGSPHDSLGEPWAQPLAEARLSSFLAADKDNNADSGPEAFISGAIEDAQSRFNLRALVDDAGKPVKVQVDALQRLCDLAGAPSDAAALIAQALGEVQGGSTDNPDGAPLRPSRWEDMAWLGLDPATLQRLEPYADLLPVATPVNLNTASREVIVAAIDGIDLGSAERLLQARQRKPFETLEAAKTLLPPDTVLEPNRVGVGSSHFYVSGRLRLEDRVLEERSLLVRRDNRVDVLRRERRSFTAPQR